MTPLADAPSMKVAAAAAEPPALAGFGVRVGAAAIDLVLWLALSLATGIILYGLAQLGGSADDPISGGRLSLLAQCAAALYFIGLMSRIGGGATVGYRLFGLRLVDQKTLTPPDLFCAILWYVTSYVRFIGFVTFFFDPRRRMLHNLTSGTVVVVVGSPWT